MKFTREKYVKLYDFCYDMDRHSPNTADDLHCLLLILEDDITEEELKETLGPDFYESD